jgi:tRNA(fMet)-specific endonuclease VapC
MSYLLDVDSCAAFIRKVPRVERRCLQNLGRLHVSVIAVTELEVWLCLPGTPLHFQHGYIAMLGQVKLLNVDEPIAHQAAKVRTAMPGSGKGVTTADLLIAATAIVHGLTLVTQSVRTFAGVPGLTVVDWSVP